MTTATKRRDLVYILAPSYTGSTLLTFLLAQHPSIATVGELKATARGDLSTYPCSCGALQRECAFWRKVEAEMQKAGVFFTLEDFGTHFRAATPLADRLLRANVRGPGFEFLRDSLLCSLPSCRRRMHDIAERNRQMIEVICKLQGGTVFLDGSKDPNRLKHLLSSNLWNMKVIYLIRDGRGAANSYMRHYNVSMEVAAKEWCCTHRECDRMVRELGEGACITIHYEDLCRGPGDVLGDTLAFLGFGTDKGGASLGGSEQHILGNAMRLRSLGEVRLDEKWKSVLSLEDLEVFKEIGGGLNRRFGYDS